MHALAVCIFFGRKKTNKRKGGEMARLVFNLLTANWEKGSERRIGQEWRREKEGESKNIKGEERELEREVD